VLNWKKLPLPPANVGVNYACTVGQENIIFYKNGVLSFKFTTLDWAKAKVKPFGDKLQVLPSGPRKVVVSIAPSVIGSGKMKEFDLDTEQVVDLPKTEFTFFTTVNLSDQVWLFGGDYHDEINEHPLQVCSFDPATRQWVYHKCSGEPPKEAKKVSVVPVDGKFYVFTKDFALDVFVLDPVPLTWSKPEVQGVGYATDKGTVTLVGRKIVFWGGVEASVFNLFRKDTNRAEVFDLSTMSWDKVEQIGDVPRARKGHSAVAFNNSLYLLAGKTEWKELTDMALCQLE